MKKEDLKTKSILLPPPPPHGRQDMGLKTHTGQQANPNPNIKAQENTLSAKPLSPFKVPLSIFKYIGKRYSWINPNKANTQTEPVLKSQTVGLSKVKQPQTKEPTLIPSRRQFIEQYGAYALVTPVALYAMMSPNRAMAQAGSGGVVAARPTVLNDGERIENFDIDTHIDGRIDKDGDLALLRGKKYIAPDGVVYTCAYGGCYITPTEGGGGEVLKSTFTITYPDDIGSSNQAAADAVDDIVDDAVVAARPGVLVDGERIEIFDINTRTQGVVYEGNLELLRGEKYIAPDGAVYTCVGDYCFINPTADGHGDVIVW